MRCLSCNRALSDSESTRKSVTTGQYIDMCRKCFSDIEDEIPTVEGANYGIEGTEEESETVSGEEWGGCNDWDGEM